MSDQIEPVYSRFATQILMPRPRRARRVSAAFFATLLLLGVTLAGAGDAARPSAGLAGNGTAQRPGLDPTYSDGRTGNQVESTEVRSNRAKVQVRLPTFFLRGVFNPCFRLISDPTSLTPPPCPDETRRKLSAEYFTNPSRRFYAGYGGFYVTSKNGSSFGILPSVRVKTLAFGSVPVEATINLRQAEAHGYLVPIKYEYVSLTEFETGSQGTPAYPGFPRTPSAMNFITPALKIRFQLSGSFDVQLTDVTVDGQPVDVGNSCHTATPTTLRVNDPRGFYYNDYSQLPRKRGTPGAFQPALDGAFTNIGAGTSDGVLDIPEFSGCGTKTQDLDPLFTGLISSDNNKFSAFVRYGFLYEYCALPFVNNCTGTERRADGARRELERAVTEHKSADVIRSLQRKLNAIKFDAARVRAPRT